MESLKGIKNKVVGMKQTIRAIEAKNATLVYLAEDAEKRIIDRIVELARSNEVEIQFVPTMKELGESCGINIATAMCAIVKN